MESKVWKIRYGKQGMENKVWKTRYGKQSIENKWHHSRSGVLSFGNGVLSWILERLGVSFILGFLGGWCVKNSFVE